jgi:bacillithiol system protein YtxJ
MVNRISTIQQFDELINNEEKFVFLKHSTTCPISHAAYTEFLAFASAYENVPLYFLQVQDDRELSNYIAGKTAIKHESPQLFIFENGEAVYNTSHFSIKKDSIENALLKK